MKVRTTQFRPIWISLIAIITGCSPAPPAQTEVADLAKTALKKYLSSLIKFRAHMEAENQSMRNGAYAMLDALRSNPSPDATPPESKAQIESEFITQAETQADETLKRVNIKLIKLGEPGKADLVAAGSQTVYWPISFEAEDPGPAATKLVLTIFAYRNPLGRWDANVKTLETQAAGIRQEIPESMLKQLGL
jgi:hypothetical protein